MRDMTPFLSWRRSPMGVGMLLKAPGVKTSDVMALDDVKVCFCGGEEEELKELRGRRLLVRLEGLVLLGLGPPAIWSFVLPL
jgi:hypothetical protein